MPSKDEVTAQYAAAEAQAAAARKADAAAKREASKKALDRLLKKPMSERFESIADPKLALTPAHRRELVRSLENAVPEQRAIIATTASRFEIWRARLPYRVIPLAMAGAVIIALFASAVTAYRHTPKQWVVIDSTEPVRVDWTSPEGLMSSETAAPGSKYVLARIEGNVAILRYWVSGTGYAEGRVPLQYLRAAN
ncbi:hypothetical protein [Beijerinckia sp. L45]|uniref:hypothetical protein n=1 Tax=Beijerinckia sp. L45 TaxID=1641855 RepID=UPI00131CE426|nr:hypothetical protein [Beijerinckia sp. L45]